MSQTKIAQLTPQQEEFDLGQESCEDSWREYTLLRIDNDVDVEPIYLLKMTCPSTGFIQAMGVQPDMQSARGAKRLGELGNRATGICSPNLK